MSHICTPKNMMISRSIPRYLTTSTSPDSCWNAATLLSFADEKLESNVLPFLLQRKGEVFMGLKAPQKKKLTPDFFFLRLKNRNRKSVKNPEFLGGCENIGYPETWLKLLEASLLDPISNVSGCTSWLRMNGSVLLADPWGESFDDFFSGPKKKVLPKKGEESFNKKKWLVTSAHGIHFLLKDLRGDVSEWSMFFVTSPKQRLVFLLVFANHLHSIFRGNKLLIFVPEAWKGKHVLPQSAGGLSMTRNCLRAEGGITRKYTIYALNLKPTNHFPSNQPDVRSNSSAPSLFDVLNELQRC